MSASGTDESGSALRDYLNVARRRKWIIFEAVVLVPVAAVAFSLTQTKLLRFVLTGARAGEGYGFAPRKQQQRQTELA